jgi:predicted dienelactone hydrolase
MLVVTTACNSTTETETEPPAEPTVEDLMMAGSYPVGFQELELTYPNTVDGEDRTLTVRVWYPATDGGEDGARYAVAGIVEVESDSLAAPAVADGGPFPLAVYSHGSGGEGLLAYPYAEHFASHGWMVVAANHTGNTALDGVNMMFDTFPRITVNRPADITALIDWVEDGAPADLTGAARTDEVFLFGHSFGAYTTFASGGVDLDYDEMVADCTADCDTYEEAGVEEALRADLGDERIVAIAPQAPALVPFFADGELAGLDVPTMLMSGGKDITTPDETQSQPAWEGLDDPNDIWVRMPDGGHLTFITVCDDLDESLLEVFQPTFREDGCGEDNIPVAEAVPTMAAYLLGFARQHVLGEDWASILTGEPFHPGFEISQH